LFQLYTLSVLFNLVLCSNLAHAQRFNQLTSEQGLSNHLVKSIYQDSKGFIWVGNYSSLDRFDGRTVESITDNQGLPVKDVRSIAEDQWGRIWIASAKSGLKYYNNGQLNSYDFSGFSENQNNHVYDLAVQSNQLFIAASSGLWQLDLDRLIIKSIYSQFPVNKIIVDQSLIWMLSNEKAFQLDLSLREVEEWGMSYKRYQRSNFYRDNTWRIYRQ